MATRAGDDLDLAAVFREEDRGPPRPPHRLAVPSEDGKRENADPHRPSPGPSAAAGVRAPARHRGLSEHLRALAPEAVAAFERALLMAASAKSAACRYCRNPIQRPAKHCAGPDDERAEARSAPTEPCTAPPSRATRQCRLNAERQRVRDAERDQRDLGQEGRVRRIGERPHAEEQEAGATARIRRRSPRRATAARARAPSGTPRKSPSTRRSRVAIEPMTSAIEKMWHAFSAA